MMTITSPICNCLAILTTMIPHSSVPLSGSLPVMTRSRSNTYGGMYQLPAGKMARYGTARSRYGQVWHCQE